jgi:glycine betaine/proline transport system permease protein
MVVIAALIGAGGLGETVWVGLGRSDVGYAAVGGIGIVTLAIIFDRITQSFGKRPEAGRTGWFGYIRNFIKTRLKKTT